MIKGLHGVDTRSTLLEAEDLLANIFQPRERLTPSQFVEVHRRISPEANAKSGGKWHNLPMQVEPMDSVIDPVVQATVLMWASQTAGKTEVCNAIVGYFISEEPSPILMLQPDLNMAETWSKDRFTTMVRDTPILATLVNERRGRGITGNKILHKTFPAGHLTVAGANSPASLASRPIRVNIFDEVDRYPESAGKEGDPILLAEKRSDTFPGSISVKTSTPTIRKHSRIEKEFDLSDKRFWFVACPECDKHQSLKWVNVRWEDEDHLGETYYECDNKLCKARWDDKTRIKVVRAGYWKATAPFRGIRGYHLNGIYSLFKPKKGYKTRLHQMAAEFLHAKKLGKSALKVWTNTFLAETWEEESETKPEPGRLYARREVYSPDKLPKGVVILTAGIDSQPDRIEIEVVGHGPGEESWGVAHYVLWGDTRLPEMYTRLEATMIKQYRREDGARLTIRAAGFDTGFAGSQRMMYAYIRQRGARCYYPFKGSNQKNAEPVSMGQKSKGDGIRLIMIGTNRIKSYIYSRSTISTPGPGFMHFPEAYTLEWFKQLLAEDCRRVITAGQSFLEFYMPSVMPEGSTDHNEALDMRVYSMAAMYARGATNWEYEEKCNLATIPPPPGQRPAPIIQKKKRRASILAGILG